MLSQNIRILDFDGSIVKQRNLLSKYPHQIISLADLAPRARLWMNKKTRAALQKRLAQEERNCVTFLGSGDFHHLTALLLAQFKEPIALISFDLHPDWDILPPRLACGAWVTLALKQKNILKYGLFGVSSEDLSFPGIQSGNLGSLKDNRLEIYPYAHEPSMVFLRRVPQNISIKVKQSLLGAKIYWDELSNKKLEDFCYSFFQRLPVKKVYVTIDKDCLRNEFALTNWEEGKLSLDELILMLKLIKSNLDVIGLDITGDYSRISIAGKLKGLISRLDHPKEVRADQLSAEEVTKVNELTNLRILEAVLP